MPSPGAKSLQLTICFSSLASLVFSSCQVCSLASSSERAFSTSLSQLLDGLVLGVILEHVELALGLLEGELGLLEVQLLGDLLGLRDVALLVHPGGPVHPVGGPAQVGLGQADLALARRLVLHVDAFLVFLDRDLGDFPGQLGVLERGLGPLGGDLLVGELVAERGRVELADQVALLDLLSLRR